MTLPATWVVATAMAFASLGCEEVAGLSDKQFGSTITSATPCTDFRAENGGAPCSCADYQAEMGWAAACNTVTAEGYFWAIGQRVAQYGYYGISGSNVEPPCGESELGTTAQTSAHDPNHESWLPVSTFWCRNLDADTACDETTEGPVYEGCDASAHCGIYEAVCSRQP